MKNTSTILKILGAVVAVAGTVYVIATYGDKIVSWAKKLLKSSEPEFVECECEECDCEECECAEDSDEAPVAEENDFVG